MSPQSFHQTEAQISSQILYSLFQKFIPSSPSQYVRTLFRRLIWTKRDKKKKGILRGIQLGAIIPIRHKSQSYRQQIGNFQGLTGDGLEDSFLGRALVVLRRGRTGGRRLGVAVGAPKRSGYERSPNSRPDKRSSDRMVSTEDRAAGGSPWLLR